MGHPQLIARFLNEIDITRESAVYRGEAWRQDYKKVDGEFKVVQVFAMTNLFLIEVVRKIISQRDFGKKCFHTNSEIDYLEFLDEVYSDLQPMKWGNRPLQIDPAKYFIGPMPDGDLSDWERTRLNRVKAEMRKLVFRINKVKKGTFFFECLKKGRSGVF